MRSAHLVDVAPVNDPAYLDTSSGLRSLAEARGLDLAIVRDHAARNELRVLLKKDMDGEPIPVADESEPQAPTADEDTVRSALDVARRRLELLRVPR